MNELVHNLISVLQQKPLEPGLQTTSLENRLIAPNGRAHESLFSTLIVAGYEIGRPGGVGQVQGYVWAQVQDQAYPPVLTHGRHRELFQGRHGTHVRDVGGEEEAVGLPHPVLDVLLLGPREGKEVLDLERVLGHIEVGIGSDRGHAGWLT